MAMPQYETARPTRIDARDAEPDMRRRRILLAGLVLTTMAGLILAMGAVLAPGGYTWAETGMLAAFALTTPWIALGFWNAVIGFIILRLHPEPARLACPAIAGIGRREAITSRNAVVMAVRNEDTERVFRHFETIQASIDATGHGEAFDYFVISDTNDETLAKAEQARVSEWRRRDRRPGRIHYRRRLENPGFKAGNVADFCAQWGERYDHMVLLDADSLMSGPAILRLVAIMQAEPKLGILQSLVVGLPSRSLFARIFQFGMRQGMRSYTLGSAWWQGDYGPYWGHNAIIRLEPFMRHCRLPVLPGNGPLSGHILSHDQVEAVLMRRAGYEVRVLPEEDGSWEENPPALPDFLKRDLRWCQGNMQYWRLLALPGLPLLGRIQLLLAILMYIGAPAWMTFLAFGAIQAMTVPPDAGQTFNPGVAIMLFATTITMSLTPKILGYVDLLIDRKKRKRYGGAGRLVGGAAGELLFSILLAPVVSLTQAIFMMGLVFRRAKSWDAQNRESQAVPWTTAFAGLWPHMLAAFIFAMILWVWAPGALVWAAPLLLGLGLAVPFTVLTASPALGEWAEKRRICVIPEENVAVEEIAAAQAGRAPANLQPAA